MKKTEKASKINPNFASKSKLTARKVTGGAVVQIQTNLHAEGKISDALQKLLAIEGSPDMSLNQLQKMLGLIVIGWNISLQDAEKRQDLVQQFIADNFAGLSDAAQSDVEYLIKKIIVTKDVLFPDDKRYVVSYDVHRLRAGLAVTAAALWLPSESNLLIANPDTDADALLG